MFELRTIKTGIILVFVLFVLVSSSSASNLINWNGRLVSDLGYQGLYYGLEDGEENQKMLSSQGHVFNMIVYGDTLIVDFGAERGVFRYDYNPETGSVSDLKITSRGTLRHLVTIKGTNKIFVDFGPEKGIYYYSLSDNSWHWVTNWGGAKKIASNSGSPDFTGLICDFGSDKGLYFFNALTDNWQGLSSWGDVKKIQTGGELTLDTIIVEFNQGIFKYSPSKGWNWLTGWHADKINWPFFDFGENGLYHNSGRWNFMSSWNPQYIDNSPEFYADFGKDKGFYTFDISGGWKWLCKGGVEKVAQRNTEFREAILDYGKKGKIFFYDTVSGASELIDKGGAQELTVFADGSLIIDLGFGRGIESVSPLNQVAHISDITSQKPRVPDTGQDKCYNEAGDIISCPGNGEEYFGQDASYTINKPSYTKLDTQGNELPDSAQDWTMVRDNVTGLVWEVKNSKDGNADYSNPNDADNTYSWYDNNPETNGGNAGTPGDGTDTEDFINALNENNYGGHSDWRMPTKKEFCLISNYGIRDPSIDTDYFPETMSSYYWSSTTVANYTDHAWHVNFSYGVDSNGNKSKTYYVRAVRGGQCCSFDHLKDNGDGTISDKDTGLMWSKNTADINNDGVIDDNDRLTWKKALEYCENLNKAGYSDWRLPSIKELFSIADLTTYHPAIDKEYFPDTMSSCYWSSTTGAYYTDYAWLVYFYNGFDDYLNKSDTYYVRAVRGGQ